MIKKIIFLCLISVTLFAAETLTYPSSAATKTIDSWDAYVSMTFLLWQAREEGVDLGYLDRNLGNTNDAILTMNYSYQPAFKVKIGKLFSHDNWEIYGQYTRYYGKDKKSGETTGDNYIYVNGDINNNHSTIADNYWRLNFNLLDVRLQRLFYVGEHVILAPVLAIKACWINQRYHARGDFSLDQSFTLDAYISSWGVGPSGGIFMDFLCPHGFYFFDTIYLSGLYQKFRTSWHENDSVEGDYGICLNKSMLNANFEAELGFGWGTYCNQDRWHYDVYVSYNFLAFGEQNMMHYTMEQQFYHNHLLPTIANLYLHGLNIAMRFDF
jgi:hypothetical protein